MKTLNNLFKISIITSISAILATLTPSCASLTQYQTAKAVGRGNVEFSGSLTGIAAEEGAVGPLIQQIAINYGVGNKTDLMSKFDGSVCIGLKHQFIGNDASQFALASGVLFGMPFFSRSGLNLNIPLHATVQVSDDFSLTLTPNYTFTPDDKGIIRQIGGFGIAPHLEFGKKFKFFFGSNFIFHRGATVGIYGLGFKRKITHK